MVKASWGTKRTCQSCAARFYDLNKGPIKCPKCGREHDREDFVKVRRGRGCDRRGGRGSGRGSGSGRQARGQEEERRGGAGGRRGAPTSRRDEALEDADDLADDAEDLEVEVEVEDDKGEGDR